MKLEFKDDKGKDIVLNINWWNFAFKTFTAVLAIQLLIYAGLILLGVIFGLLFALFIPA